MRVITLILAATLISSRADAGDATAHTAAMVGAARQVASRPDLHNGVGGSKFFNVPDPGEFPAFLIPTGHDRELRCADSDCAVSDADDGGAINAPDHWSCLSSDQPPGITMLNLQLGPVLANAVPELCNYNHFTSNPILDPAYSAPATAELARRFADDIIDSITSDTCDWTCDQTDWHVYYQRVVNALHYVQDIQSEHHALGNQDCGLTGETFNRFERFRQIRGCAGFLDTTYPQVIGLAPALACDDEVVLRPPPDAPPELPVVLSGHVNLGQLACDHGSPFACMGLERLIRHHCALPGTGKSLVCFGPQDDHRTSTDRHQYCEGELYNHGGGQDFLGLAQAASVPILEAAMQRWATACKQPDDPCDPTQCKDWCQRSTPPDLRPLLDPDGGAVAIPGVCTTREAMTGYCGNPGSDCRLHTCECGPITDCGDHNARCCQDGAPCQDPADECGELTGTCVAAGSEQCDQPDPGGDDPQDPPDTTGTTNGDPHLRTFDGARYDLQAVGELTLARDARDGLEVQVRTHPWGSSTQVAVNVAVAMRVDDHVVAFYVGGDVRVDHALTAIPQGKTALGAASLFRFGSTYIVAWPDGGQLRLTEASTYLGAALYVAEARRGHTTGLLGDGDGELGNELTTRDGVVLAAPVPAAAMYGVYAESWRIAQVDSLFDYGPEETTETFTDRTFPHQLATSASLPAADAAAALAVCQAAGVAEDWLEACLVDVGFTGDPSFATALASAPPAPTSIDVDTTAGPLTGATVTFGVRYPVITTPISRTLTAVIGDGVEFVAIQGSALPGFRLLAADVDVAPAAIDIHFHDNLTPPAVAFNGYVLSFAATGLPAIHGATIDPVSSPEVAGARITFDDTSVSINLGGRAIRSTSRLVVDLTF